MKNANDLLFVQLFDGKPLFKSQLELATQFLNTPGSAYEPKTKLSKEDESKALGRLKTYISQLLSENIFRNITEDFKVSLKLVLTSKLPPNLSEDVFLQVIDLLQKKNDGLTKKEDIIPQFDSKASLKEDIKRAKYVVVVSARPIDMNLPPNEKEFTVRTWFYEDLVKTLLEGMEAKKNYRFNFPTPTYCELFWQGLEKIMIKFLVNLAGHAEYIRFLYNANFSITTETLHDYEEYLKIKDGIPKDDELKVRMDIMPRIAKEVIERLNRNKFILVFHNSHPIFSIPIIAINPNESNSKVYGLLDADEDINIVYKFSQENTVLWRLFFWDKVKSSESGTNVNYPKGGNKEF